jgi:hypothetical protein
MNCHSIRAIGLFCASAAFVSSCEPSKKSTVPYEIYDMGAGQFQSQSNYVASFEEKPGWPPTPRRDQSWETSSFKSGSISLGIKVAAFGSEASSTTKVKFDVVRRNRLWILMHTPTMKEQMYNKSEGGIFLNAQEGYKMVAVCFFSVHLGTDARTSAGISVQGTGVEGEAGLARETSVSQMSDFYPVKFGDSIEDWFKKCDEVFESKVRASVEKDIEAASASMLYHVKQDQCLIPDTEEDRFLSSGKAGDKSCEGFLRGLLPGVSENYTARCIPQQGAPQNVGLCRIRSPEKLNCKLYQDDYTGDVSEMATETSTLVTGPFSYPCDKTKKLRCVVAKEGGWFKTWTEIYRSYEGICVQ